MSNIENFDIRTQIIDSIVATFDSIVSMKIKVSDSEPPDTAGESRMVAAVSFAGNITGLMNIQVTQNLAKLMMTNMLKREPEEIEGDTEMKDILADISNTASANFKSALNNAGYACAISTPTLTYGADFSIKSVGMERFERIVFSYQDDLILVDVGLQTQKIPGNGDDFSNVDALNELTHVDIEKFNALDCKVQVSEAVIDVFNTKLSTQLEPAETIPADSLETVRNVGSVNFAGDATGMVCIHVGDKFSRKLAADMLGMAVEELEGEAEIKDMMGELGNIVGTKLKSAFTDVGLSCALSMPTFTTGTDYNIESLNTETFERLAFRSDDNIVFVEMGVKFSELVQAAGRQEKNTHHPVGEEKIGDNLSQKEITPLLQATNEAGKDAAKPSESTSPQPEPANQEAEIHPAEPQQPPTPQSAPPESPKNEAAAAGDFDLDLLLDIPLEIKVELGRARIQIQELLNLSPGSALKLVKLESEPVDILANDTLIARGEVVVQNEKYGIRVTEITSRIQRIRSFSI